MKLTLQKRIAADLLKCSTKKIVLQDTRLKDIKEAITKKDIRTLIKEKAIKKKQDNEQSRSHANHIQKQKRKGKRKGAGSKKGAKFSRLKRKDRWIAKIRAQRKLLTELKEDKKVTMSTYRDIYRKSKGGFFRSRRHINLYLEEHGLIKNGK